MASLRARPVRTAVSILAVALEVTLILVVVGLTTGIMNETGKRIEGIGADLMLQAPNSGILLGMSASVMPETLAPKIAEVEGVKAVTPVLVQTNSQNGLELVYGIDPTTFNAVSGGFRFVKGRMFKDFVKDEQNEIIVDDWYAAAKGVDVGDEVELLNQKFRISGIVENGKGARVFISLPAAQDNTGSIGKATTFFIELESPDSIAAVTQRLNTMLPTYPVRNMREYLSLMTSENIPGLDAFIQTVVFVAVCIGVLVIFLSMYTTITERTREIGILRSLGASKSFIVTLILQESVLLCVLGVVIGLGSSFIVARGIKLAYATLVVDITPDWMWKAAVFAILSGVIGSLYPSIKAAKQDPIEALAYE